MHNKAKLAAILTYHVVSGKVMASTVVTMDGKKVATVNARSSTPQAHNGAEATIKVGADGVMVDGAKVVTTDMYNPFFLTNSRSSSARTTSRGRREGKFISESLGNT